MRHGHLLRSESIKAHGIKGTARLLFYYKVVRPLWWKKRRAIKVMTDIFLRLDNRYNFRNTTIKIQTAYANALEKNGKQS